MWQTCFPKSRNNWGWWTTRLPPSSCLGTATRSWAEPKSIDTDTAIHLSGCTFVFSFVCTFVSTFQVAPLFSAAHNRRSLYLIFLLTRASYKKKKQLTGLSTWQKISFVTITYQTSMSNTETWFRYHLRYIIFSTILRLLLANSLVAL